MKWRDFILGFVASGVLFASLSGASAPVFDEETFFTFVKHVSTFERRYLGCDETGFPPDLRCSSGKAHFDLAEYREIGRFARKLFGTAALDPLPASTTHPVN